MSRTTILIHGLPCMVETTVRDHIESQRARIGYLEEAIDQSVQVIEHGLGDSPINHALGILRAARRA